MTVVKHPKETLHEEIALVDSKLARPVTVYLIGGGAMSFQGLKNATKDIDGILQNDGDLQSLATALEQAGYTASNELDPEYLDLSATCIYAKDGAPQWDLFNRIVCKKLRLSSGMRARSTRFDGSGSKLELRLIAPEDIFVFKSITERQGDVPDVDMLWASGLDWDAILGEMKWQCEHSDQAWAASFLETLQRLRDGGRAIPILKDVDALVDVEEDEWAVLIALQSPSTDVADTKQGRSRAEVITHLQRSIDVDVTQHVEAAIQRLVERGRIIDGDELQLNPNWDPDAA